MRKEDKQLLFIFLGGAAVFIFLKMATDTSSSFWKTTVLICETIDDTLYYADRLRIMEVRIKESRIPNPLAPPSTIFLKSLNGKIMEDEGEVLHPRMEKELFNIFLKGRILRNDGAVKILFDHAERQGKTFGTKTEALENLIDNPNTKEKVFFINPWRDDYESFFTRGTLIVELDKHTGRMEFHRGHADCKKKEKLF